MKKIIILTFVLIVLLTSCKSQDSIDKDMKQLKKELIDESYSSLFLSTNNKVDTLWSNYGNNAFIELVNDTTAEDNIRFLTAEILFHKSVSFPPKDMYKVLGSIYVNALKITGLSNNKIVLAANGWGFLYNMDHVGFLGERLILIGEPAINGLKSLLDNTDTVLYEGSKEATVGNAYHYRIKDIAAFYISKIKNIPVKFHQNIEDRDAEILRLKELLK
jgi:hypothetical protein